MRSFLVKLIVRIHNNNNGVDNFKKRGKSDLVQN